MRKGLLVSLFVLIAGCTQGPDEPGPNEPVEQDEAFHPGLQYAGAIAIGNAGQPSIELSAPLFPDSVVFQQFQDASLYPTLSDADRDALLDDIRTFEQLVPLCAATHPAIKQQSPGGPPLTPAEIATNYDEVARCGYEDYGAKPYWVPEHVSDVDICSAKLGDDWRLPTEADVATLQESDFAFFQSTLAAQPGQDEFPVHFYYSLDVYVRGNDGALALGNLAPQTDHVVPLPVSGAAMNELYIGNGKPIGLRCLRLPSPAP
ncbi:hypothetical protein [Polyangium jinanense]|uniref:Lipoprotein n=1 Tax=Polyangium jinanense TaxID=2829994 RepID=A0A9X3X4Y4_9BACT|nr:hypothetical protein [Polyangium jinanense]MDC3954793.1 hypothetical protein [Polyangium jinanense]MDC3981436.1 hypothetical protein [Polyangium jinanense]